MDEIGGHRRTTVGGRRHWRPTALLAALALLAGACGSGTDTASTGVAESEAGEVNPATDQSGGATTDDGTAEAASATTNQQAEPADTVAPAADGSDNSPPPATDGSDFKQATGLAIDDLTEAEIPLGLDRADIAPAVFGQPNEGAIEEAFGIDRWSFEATDGQMLGVDVLDIDHDCRQDLTLVLESPSGERGAVHWIGNGACNGHGPLILDETGTWYLDFIGGSGGSIKDNTGGYRFVPYFLTERDVAPAAFDVPNEGEIAELFGVDRWTFEGEAGQLLTVDVLDIDNDCRQDLTLVLEDPFADRFDISWVGNGGCFAHGPIELENSGTYAIEFHGGSGSSIDDKVGTYRFVPSFLTERDESSATAGTQLSGEISEVYGVDRWSFDAEAGQLLTVDVLAIDNDCRQDLTLVLEDPFAEREDVSWIGNGGCRAHGPIELDRAGTYVLEFAGGGGSSIKDKLGAYSFVFNLS